MKQHNLPPCGQENIAGCVCPNTLACDASQAFFTALDQVGTAIYIIRLEDDVIIAANRTAEKFLGPDPSGKKFHELIMSRRNGSDSLPQLLYEDRRPGSSIPFEFKSENRWYKSISRLFEPDNSPALRIEIITDITEIKDIEKENNDLKVFREKVEDLPHVPVISFGRRGKIKMMNQAAKSLLQYTDKDLDFLHIWNLVDDGAREKIYDLTEHFSNSDRQSLECEIKAKKSRFRACLDILLRRDVKGVFTEATVFIIKNT